MGATWITLVCLGIVVTVTNHSYFCEAASVSDRLLDNSTNVSSNETLNNVTTVNTTDLFTPTPPVDPIAVVAVLSTDDVTSDDAIAEGKLKINHDDDDKKKMENQDDSNEITKRPCPRKKLGENQSVDSNGTSTDQLDQGTALEKISESIVGAFSTIKNSVTSIFSPGTGLPESDHDDMDCHGNETLEVDSTETVNVTLPVSEEEGSSVNLTNVPVDFNLTTTTTTELPLNDGETSGNLTTTSSPSTSTQVPSEISVPTSTLATSSTAPVETEH